MPQTKPTSLSRYLSIQGCAGVSIGDRSPGKARKVIPTSGCISCTTSDLVKISSQVLAIRGNFINEVVV
ncbi:MAG: hypothetical protein IM547_01470 [Chitinophagaceae bacterium]|nr:hypothetical protein [Chitinophagaceae bacterium]